MTKRIPKMKGRDSSEVLIALGMDRDVADKLTQKHTYEQARLVTGFFNKRKDIVLSRKIIVAYCKAMQLAGRGPGIYYRGFRGKLIVAYILYLNARIRQDRSTAFYNNIKIVSCFIDNFHAMYT